MFRQSRLNGSYGAALPSGVAEYGDETRLEICSRRWTERLQVQSEQLGTVESGTQFRARVERTPTETASDQPPASAGRDPVGPRRYRPGYALLGGAAAVAATALTTCLVWPTYPHVAFHERGWLLVAAFENRTGDQVLDDSLQYLLEQELSASPFIRIVPRLRVEDTLRLIGGPPIRG